MIPQRWKKQISDLELDKFDRAGAVRMAPGGGAGDAFSRLRVSQPTAVFDSKQVGADDVNIWDTITVGTADAVYSYNTSSTVLSVGATAGDRVYQQSRHYWPYLPGRSHFIAITGTIGAPAAGCVKRMGYFDDGDGMFLQQSGDGSVAFVIRSSTSGSPVDTVFPQQDWNMDVLDGKSRGSIEALDLTKSQILLIDFQWLGVGVVRFGFDIDGEMRYAHISTHANQSAGVYTRTPSLPVRYEVVNVTGGNTTSMERICSTVMSEGGYENPGYEYAVSNGIVKRTIAARTPILAIRPSVLLSGQANRTLIKLLSQGLFVSGGDAFWELMHIHDPSAVVGNFVTVAAGAGADYSVDITSITATAAHRIAAGYATSAVGGRGGEVRAPSFIERHTYISRNADNTNAQYLVLFATPFTGAVDVSGVIGFVEFR